MKAVERAGWIRVLAFPGALLWWVWQSAGDYFTALSRTKIFAAGVPERVAVTSTRSLAGAVVSVMTVVPKVTVVPATVLAEAFQVARSLDRS